jgi:pimeloyl-ACP methyl ester carboxylesterase
MVAGLLKGPLVIPDRPGYGLSYRLEQPISDLRSAAAVWLLQLVDGLAVEQINLVGASMGGLFAIAFATAHRQRVRRLIILGAAPGLFHDFPLFLRLMAAPGLGRILSRLPLSDVETMRKRVFSGYCVHPERIPTDLLEVAVAGTSLPGTAFTTHTILHAATTMRGLRPQLSMHEDMKHLPAPTRFVWGDQDQVATSQIAYELAQNMRDATLEVITDAGHLPHLDQPQAVAAAINPELGPSTRSQNQN